MAGGTAMAGDVSAEGLRLIFGMDSDGGGGGVNIAGGGDCRFGAGGSGSTFGSSIGLAGGDCKAGFGAGAGLAGRGGNSSRIISPSGTGGAATGGATGFVCFDAASAAFFAAASSRAR
jgi:hypothetical protein